MNDKSHAQKERKLASLFSQLYSNIIKLSYKYNQINTSLNIILNNTCLHVPSVSKFISH